MPFEPHRQRSDAAQRQVTIVRPGHRPEDRRHDAQTAEMLLADREHPHHDIGMAHQVLGRRLNGNIDAMLERLEIKRRRPGIVQHHHRAGGMGGGGDRRDVLHFEGQRARRFGKDQLGVGLDQLGDAGADLRIEIGDLDPEALEDDFADLARRAVGAVDHQQVIAGIEKRHQRGVDGGQSRRRGDGAVSAFQFGHRFFEGEGGRRAIAPVIDAVEGVGGLFLKFVEGLVNHRRGMIDGRIDHALLDLGVAAGLGHLGGCRMLFAIRAIPGHGSLRRRALIDGGVAAHAPFRP